MKFEMRLKTINLNIQKIQTEKNHKYCDIGYTIASVQ